MAISAELGDTLEAVVEDLVRNGRYNSKSEVLREGVRLVQEREAAFAELKRKIDEGVAAANRGDVMPIEEVFDELLARYRSRSKTA